MKPTLLVACEDEPHSHTYLAALAAVGLDASHEIRLLIPAGRSDLATLEREVAVAAASAAGVVLCGGPDVNPTRYGEAVLAEAGVEWSDELDALDLGLLAGAREAATPVLAICRGLQVANVFCGGTLWQDLPRQWPSALVHQVSHPKDALAHPVTVTPGVHHPLAELLSAEPATVVPLQTGTGNAPERRDADHGAWVNSRHHQAIKDLASDLLAVATTSDGLIEACATTDNHWWLWAVQWHPENLLADDRQRALFTALAERVQRQQPLSR